jgi:hypothetical protein
MLEKRLRSRNERLRAKTDSDAAGHVFFRSAPMVNYGYNTEPLEPSDCRIKFYLYERIGLSDGY